MSLTFRPLVLPSWFVPTKLNNALEKRAGEIFTAMSWNSGPRALRLEAFSIDMWYGSPVDPDQAPVPSAFVSLVGMEVNPAPGREEVPQRIDIEDVVDNRELAAEILFAYVASSSGISEFSQITLSPPSGGWMRLFVFPDVIMILAEYCGTIEQERLKQLCATGADEVSRAGLGTVMLPVLDTNHAQITMLARKNLLESRMKNLLLLASDLAPGFSTLQVEIDLMASQS